MTTNEELEKRIEKIEKRMAAETKIWQQIADELEKNLQRIKNKSKVIRIKGDQR